MGETYIPVFALALGAGEIISGLIATLPLALGSILQLFAPYGIRKMGSYRKWVVLTASLQGFSLLPLAFIGFRGFGLSESSVHPAFLFLLVALYWGSGMSTGPAWNTWMSYLIPRQIRIPFFSRRGQITYAATLVGLLSAGWILELGHSPGTHQNLYSFGILFLIAAFFRLLSARFLWHQVEPFGIIDQQRNISFKDFFSSFKGGTYSKILAFLFISQIGVNFSAPFYAPYMLKQLHFGYWQFVLTAVIALVSKIISYRYLSTIAQTKGPRFLMLIGALGMAPLPLFWAVADSFSDIVAIQIFAGFAWAAMDLSSLLILFAEIPGESRVSILTKHNFLNTSMMLLGSLMGGYLLKTLGTDPASYQTLFLGSAVLRIASLLIVVRILVPKRHYLLVIK